MEEKIFKDSFSFFSNLYSYLENGYIILDSPFLCLKLKNGEKEVVLKLEKEGIKTSNFIYSDYSNTLLNVIAGFKHNYGFDTCYEVDKILFDKKYEHTLF